MWHSAGFGAHVGRRLARIGLTLALVAAVGATTTAHAAVRTPAADHWVGAWEAPPESGGFPSDDQSFRMLVHTSIGGSVLRLRFSNWYGAKPLTLHPGHHQLTV